MEIHTNFKMKYLINRASAISPREDLDELIKSNPLAKRFIRPVIGANEFINGIERWSIWVMDEDLEEALLIKPINERIQKTKENNGSWRLRPKRI